MQNFADIVINNISRQQKQKEYSAKRTGYIVEDKFYDCLKSALCKREFYRTHDKDKAKENAEKLLKRYTGSKLDREQGTDAVYDDKIRIDFTTNFSNKDHVVNTRSTGITVYGMHNLLMGIRTGNNYGPNKYTKFEKPVVVLGVNMTPGEFKRHDDIITDNLTFQGEKILDLALAYYERYERSQTPNLNKLNATAKHIDSKETADPETKGPDVK